MTHDFDTRKNFSQVDDLCLLNAQEFAELIGLSMSSLYTMRSRTPESLPQPVSARRRKLVWRAGDIRAWLRSLPLDPSPRPRHFKRLVIGPL
jgi:predicted DNA-binding transcriptional regulator AlpA